MKITLEEFHYINIIVDSMMDGDEMLNRNKLNRKDVYEYMKKWVISYKEDNNIEEMRKEDFLKISDKCIEEYHLNNLVK